MNIILVDTVEAGFVYGRIHYAKTSVRTIFGPSAIGPCAFLANVQTSDHNKYYSIVPSPPVQRATSNFQQANLRESSPLFYSSDSSNEQSEQNSPQSVGSRVSERRKQKSNVKRKSHISRVNQFDSRSNSPQFNNETNAQVPSPISEENIPSCISNEHSRESSPQSFSQKKTQAKKASAVGPKRRRVASSKGKTIVCDCDIVQKNNLPLDKDVLDYQRYTNEHYQMKSVSGSQCSKAELRTVTSIQETLKSRFEIINDCKISENGVTDCFTNAHSQYYAVLDSLSLQGHRVDETLTAGKIRYLCYQEYVQNHELYENLMNELTKKLGISEEQYLDRLQRHHPGDDLSLKLLASVLQINISVGLFDFNQNTDSSGLTCKIIAMNNIVPERIICRAKQIHRTSFIYQTGTNYFRMHFSIMPNPKIGAQTCAMRNLPDRIALPFKCNVHYGDNEKNAYHAELYSQRGKVFDDHGKLLISIDNLPLHPKEYDAASSVENMEVDSEIPTIIERDSLDSELPTFSSPLPSNISSSSEKRAVYNKRYYSKKSVDKLREISVQKQWPYEFNITTESRNNCIQDFIERTSDDCLKLNVCFTCGIREFDSHKVEIIDFSLFKNEFYNVLKKSTSHESISNKTAFRQNKNPDLEVKDFNATDFFLEKRGIREITSNGSVVDLNFTICNSCFKTFKGHRIPSTAILNNNYYGDVPEALQGLTIIEEILVSRVRVVMCVMTLRDGGGNRGYRCLRGNCVAFPQDQIRISRILPNSLDSIGEYLQVVFVGSTIPTESEILKRVLRVRKKKVREAIDCIINSSNGQLTHQSHFDEVIFNTLPDDGIPDEVLRDINLQSDPKVAERDDAAHSAYYNNSSEKNSSENNSSESGQLMDTNEEDVEEPIYHINQYGQVDSDGVGITDETRMREGLVQLNLDSINHVQQKRRRKRDDEINLNMDLLNDEDEEYDDSENPNDMEGE
jgi:hypothetical protein